MASSNDFYRITGIQDGLDPQKKQELRTVHLRLELDDWYLSPQILHVNQRALFFPAFWEFSQMKPQEKTSWFQIAERPDLYEAARTWRLPYWDWAMKKPLPENPSKMDYNVPLVVLTKEVRIRQPTILGYGPYPNAFYQFTMRDRIEMGDKSLRNTDPLKDLRITESIVKYYPEDPKKKPYPVTVHFDKCKATSRHPTESGVTKAWEDGFQDNAAIAKALRDYRWDPIDDTEDDNGKGNLTASLRDAFYRLTTIDNFEDFASMRAPGAGAGTDPQKKKFVKDYAFDSSENIHNNMHDWCGGPVTKPDGHNVSQMGHMAHVPLAAFDPIFWVHHRHISVLVSRLNRDYNSAWAAAEKAELTADPGQDDGIKLTSMASLIAEAKRDPMDLEIDDYVVNVIYEKFALNGTSFTIHIFVGKVPDQLPYTFQAPGTQVGEVFNFSTEPGSMGNSPEGCQNCRNQQHDHTKSTGRVILTNALITRFKNQVPHVPVGDGPRTLASMKPEDVVPFLKANFHWRVTSMGALVDPDRIPSLKVSVAVGKANHYADRSKLSEFHDYKGAHEITQGRPGGAGPDDGMYPPDAVYRSGT
ncbi:hypothetical protein P7C71_g5612, partial [Lecanoromycetidae sp. Uapishka_2]